MRTKKHFYSKNIIIGIVFLIFCIGFAAAGGQGEGKTEGEEGPVVLDFATFWVGTNPLKPWHDALVEAFTEKYQGQFELSITEIPGDQAYADRMRANAAAGELPDIITGNVGLMQDLRDSGELVELTQYLDADPEWKNSFHPQAFDYYYTDEGELYALPYSRDNIGIYYNKDLFAQAGIDAFPKTWDEFFSVSNRLQEAGILPFAMSNDWVNGLMLANMIGTQEEGEEWIRTKDYKMRFSESEAVKKAVEMLREYVSEGYSQEGSAAAPYAEAATLFLQAEAAMIANGPWMINNIKGIGAETAPGLYENVDYAVSPGSGIISIFGEAAFATGADTDATIEGAIEFLKLVTSKEQMVNQMILVTRPGTVPVELTEEQRAEVDPLLLSINEKAKSVDHTYPHLNLAIPQVVWEELKNFWPAHVTGSISTEEFLQALDDRWDSYLRE